MAKILVIEDNQYNREMLAKRLQRAGFDIAAAVDGREGIEMARTAEPDVILMDLDLPEIDGWEATRRLKANTITSGIPIIALTAHAMPQDLKKAVDAGCDQFETKPVMFARLLEKIHVCLRQGLRSGVAH
jgi:CheY-like chemotaxis protein